MNLVAGGAGRTAVPTMVGAAAQAYPFDPLTTAAMAVALCGGLYVLRLVRGRTEVRRTGPLSSTSEQAELDASSATEPTERAARR